jgi:hypothetical protein
LNFLKIKLKTFVVNAPIHDGKKKPNVNVTNNIDGIFSNVKITTTDRFGYGRYSSTAGRSNNAYIVPAVPPTRLPILALVFIVLESQLFAQWWII